MFSDLPHDSEVFEVRSGGNDIYYRQVELCLNESCFDDNARCHIQGNLLSPVENIFDTNNFQ